MMRHAHFKKYVAIAELGPVVLEGRSRRGLHVRARPGEPPFDEWAAEVAGLLRTPDETPDAWHPALSRLVAERSLDPELSVAEIEALSMESRWRLASCLLKAHPATSKALDRSEKVLERAFGVSA